MLAGLDLEEMPLDRAMNVILTLWVEDYGALSAPQETREAIDRHVEKIDGVLDPETWGTSERAQREQAALLAAGGRRPTE